MIFVTMYVNIIKFMDWTGPKNRIFRDKKILFESIRQQVELPTA